MRRSRIGIAAAVWGIGLVAGLWLAAPASGARLMQPGIAQEPTLSPDQFVQTLEAYAEAIDRAIFARLDHTEYIFWQGDDHVVLTYGSHIERRSLTADAAPDWEVTYPHTIFAAAAAGPWLAVSSSQEITLYDAWTGVEAARLEPDNGLIRALVLSPDGKLLAATGSGGRLLVWDILQQTVLFENTDGYVELAFSPDSHWLASAEWDLPLTLWDVSDPADIHSAAVGGPGDNVDRTRQPLVFSPDGRWLARLDSSGVQVLSLPALTPAAHVTLEMWLRGPGMTFSPNSDWLFISHHTDLHYYVPETLARVGEAATHAYGGDIDTLLFNPSGTLLLVRTEADETVIVTSEALTVAPAAPTPTPLTIPFGSSAYAPDDRRVAAVP